MTTQPADARPACMVGALDRIRAAENVKAHWLKACRQPPIGFDGETTGDRYALPGIYWALLAEATVLAELAKAPTDVGIAAGTHMTARDERIAESRARREQFFAQAQYEAQRRAEKENRAQFDADQAAAAQHRAEQFGDPRKVMPHRYPDEPETLAAFESAAGSCPACTAGTCTLHTLFKRDQRVRITRGIYQGRTGKIDRSYPERSTAYVVLDPTLGDQSPSVMPVAFEALERETV